MMSRSLLQIAPLRTALLRRELSAADLLLPTTGTIYRTAAIQTEPLQLNVNLGLYTTFVNLLGLTAVALPTGFRSNGLPFGVSLIAPAFAERQLLQVADRFQRSSGLPLGAPPGASAN